MQESALNAGNLQSYDVIDTQNCALFGCCTEMSISSAEHMNKHGIIGGGSAQHIWLKNSFMAFALINASVLYLVVKFKSFAVSAFTKLITGSLNRIQLSLCVPDKHYVINE